MSVRLEMAIASKNFNFHFNIVTIIFFISIFLCCLSWLMICSSYEKTAVYLNMSRPTAKFKDSELPICAGHQLNQGNRHFKKNASKSFRKTLMLKPKFQSPYSCQLVQYTKEHTVKCLDILFQEQMSHRISKINRTKRPWELRFVFMGDSRIRQQFFQFLRLIPDYDKKIKPNLLQSTIHEDLEFSSKILKLHVFFKWRPLLNSNVTDTIRIWANSDKAEQPYWMMLGMAAHHMLQINDANFQLYKHELLKLVPILENLAMKSQVIWLNQYPTIDFFGDNALNGRGHNTDIYTGKIHRYNEAVQHILKNKSGIRLWDSSNPLAEEYVRSCAVNSERVTVKGIFSLHYISCDDYIHTGTVALSTAIQLLFNDICNAKFEKIGELTPTTKFIKLNS